MGTVYPPTNTYSVLTMPIPGTKLAPEKFKGEYNYVSRFIQHYERLCDQHRVTVDKEKCETITQYCSKKVGEFIEALESYVSSNWDQLKKDLLKFYDNDRSSKRYRQKDILAYTEDTKLKKIKDLSTWKRYTRGFVRIGGWLKSKGKISDEEHATYFWQGIPRTLRLRIENRLLAQDPTRSLARAWPVDRVEAAAEAILQRDRFDRNLIDSDDEEDDETDDEDSREDEADSSDEDSEAEIKRLKKKAKKLKELSTVRKTKKKLLTKKYIDSDDEDSRPKKVASKNSSTGKSGDHQEVEELIKQLNSMSLNDPGYGIAYFKAIKMDKDVEKVVRRPMNGNGGNGNNNRAPNNPPFRRDPPPHLTNQSAPPGEYQRPPMKCYGCGGLNHGIMSCNEILDLINKGILVRDQTGRITKADGTYIRRISPDEPFVVALERERKSQLPHSNLVTFADPEMTYMCLDDNDSVMGDEAEVEGAWIQELGSEEEGGHFVYPAEIKKRGVAESSRKKANNKVYPEPLPPGTAKGKERMNPPPRTNENVPAQPDPASRRYGTRANMQGKDLISTDNPERIPTPAPVPVTVPPKEKVAEPTPVNVREREWDPDEEEDMIEDQPIMIEPKSRKQGTTQPLQDKTNDRKKPSPRKSAVSAHVDPMTVLTRLLSTPVQLQVGEVLGVSKELSGLLNDSIKLKSTRPIVASSFITRTRGVLIKLQMECDGTPITAIIDTGSQLNIVSKSSWKSVIKRPMDIAKTLSMNDANGGEGTLRGLVQHVPLMCGNVATEANLYVGEHVPFQLLLGRPWQRGNFVSIDERREGTYLLFKDPRNLEVRYEIMVAAESPDPGWNFDPNVWKVPENYIITVPGNPEASPKVKTRREPELFPIWNNNFLMRKAKNAAMFTAREGCLIMTWVIISTLQLMLQVLGRLSEDTDTGEELEDIKSEGNEILGTQIQENSLPTNPTMTQTPPTGRIFNTFIHEDRTPVVPSTISCSFQDRTDSEIIDRVGSEVPYHRRTGFLNQGIIGSHSVTELRPEYEAGQLTRRAVYHDAVIITNGDNSDEPNVMFGDLILKFFPRRTVSSRQLGFPMYTGPTIPSSFPGPAAAPPPLNRDIRSAEPLSFFVNVQDQRSTTTNEPRIECEASFRTPSTTIPTVLPPQNNQQQEFRARPTANSGEPTIDRVDRSA